MTSRVTRAGPSLGRAPTAVVALLIVACAISTAQANAVGAVVWGSSCSGARMRRSSRTPVACPVKHAHRPPALTYILRVCSLRSRHEEVQRPCTSA